MPFPPPGDPNPGNEPGFPVLQGFFTVRAARVAQVGGSVVPNPAPLEGKKLLLPRPIFLEVGLN